MHAASSDICCNSNIIIMNHIIMSTIADIESICYPKQAVTWKMHVDPANTLTIFTAHPKAMCMWLGIWHTPHSNLMTFH